ncbi:MAG: methylated-DNA--[protein]-cysteine S-methyltransferase [Thermoanaerobaculum sp.]|nr:methylated-DNA--[protein]-cysteine S-methyltransferase [Thermoanaerobaculum sp.]MDW7968356.1 methylated-DNA--[protein]-cysteine S-methyltransferase [Thermoanaerobaculum sp.]
MRAVRQELARASLATEIGFFVVTANQDGVLAVQRLAQPWGVEEGDGQAWVWALSAVEELAEYLGGRRQAFSVPLVLGGTPFQQKVWQALPGIPYGTTIAYTELAQALGKPKAARAVGAACAANPVPILLPCHRVVGRGGMLKGYALGLPVKEYLLALERRNNENPR